MNKVKTYKKEGGGSV